MAHTGTACSVIRVLALLMLVWFVAVGGRAIIGCNPHVHVPCVFAGPRAICGNSSRPALAIARRSAVCVFQRFVGDIGVGVGEEGPNLADGFHV